jgi:quercetin dioxygenase-like cupin family protein
MQNNMSGITILFVLCLLAVAPVQAGEPLVTVVRTGEQQAEPADARYFTGHALVVSRFQGSVPARVGGGLVTFAPGARTAWHSHPLGQTLFVTAGVGLVQSWGGSVQEIRAGDVVWIPPGVKHWHGASASSGMSHFAVAESLNGSSVIWMEKVSEQQYLAR